MSDMIHLSFNITHHWVGMEQIKILHFDNKTWKFDKPVEFDKIQSTTTLQSNS